MSRNTKQSVSRKYRYAGMAMGVALILLFLGTITGCAEEEPIEDPVGEPFETPEEEPMDDPFGEPDEIEELEELEELEDEDLQEFFDDDAALVPDEGENGFEQARPQLEQQLLQQKQDELIMDHLDDLTDEAEVETFLDDADTGDEEAVVAAVNGDEIYMKELLQMEDHERQQMAMFGVEPDSAEADELLEELRPNILENLVAVKVVELKAEELGITVSEDEVEQQYQMYVQQSGGEDALEEQLDSVGLTIDDLKKEIAQQLPVQLYLEQYLQEQLEEQDFDISEEELRELYEMQQEQADMFKM